MEDIAMTIRQKLTTTALLGRFGLAAVLPGASAIADDVQWDKTFYDVETGATVDLTEGGGSPLEEATLSPTHNRSDGNPVTPPPSILSTTKGSGQKVRPFFFSRRRDSR